MLEMMISFGVGLGAALLPLLVVFVYFRRFTRRKEQIASRLERADAAGTARDMRRETQMQHREWKTKLDLDLPSYLYPTAIASVLAATGMVLIFTKYAGDQTSSSELARLARLIPGAAVAGFAGAYIWSLYDLVDRFRILNLPVSTLHLVWFRLLLGPALGVCAQQLGILGNPVVVFMVMAFPVASLTKWIQDQASQRAGIAAGATAPPLWELIQGLTPDVILRLGEAGVSNLTHLANQDPVNLMRRTNLDWRNVLDMMDQAYLATYIGDNISKWRAKGIRGSIEAAVLWCRLDRGDTASRSDAEAVTKSLAADLGIDETAVKNLLRNLWEDPQVDLIWSLWFDRDATGQREKDRGTEEQQPLEGSQPPSDESSKPVQQDFFPAVQRPPDASPEPKPNGEDRDSAHS